MSKITETIPNINAIRSGLVLIVSGVAIFAVAYSPAGFALKTLIAVAILVAGLALIFFRGFASQQPDTETAAVDQGSDLEQELSTLEEAAVYFSASMEPEEMLRLVAARLRAAIPGAAVDFYLNDDPAGIRNIILGGQEQTRVSVRLIRHLIDLISASFSAGTIQKNKVDKVHTAGVPLKRGNEVVSVLTIWTDSEAGLPSDQLLEMVAARVEPLIAGSLSFASSVNNALTDNLTNLPNERAMFLILENQVAEAQRFGKVRPLSVLAIDINSFDEINRRFGHATGDRLLSFTGSVIREQLRKMDFLARTSDDEFVLILPTAESEASGNIRQRIESAFEAAPFQLGDKATEIIRLNFGSATFGEDGETATALIRSALERKQIDKASIKGSVIRFPKADD